MERNLGFTKFPEGQSGILEAFVRDRHDTWVVCNTDFGKSLFYLLPPLLHPKTVYIVLSHNLIVHEDQQKMWEAFPFTDLPGNAGQKWERFSKILRASSADDVFDRAGAGHWCLGKCVRQYSYQISHIQRSGDDSGGAVVIKRKIFFENS